MSLRNSLLMLLLAFLAFHASERKTHAQTSLAQDAEIKRLIRLARSKDATKSEKAIATLRVKSANKPVVAYLCVLATQANMRTAPSTHRVILELDSTIGSLVPTLLTPFLPIGMPNDLNQVKRFDKHLEMLAVAQRKILAESNDPGAAAVFAKRTLQLCVSPPVRLSSSNAMGTAIESSIAILEASALSAFQSDSLNTLRTMAAIVPRNYGQSRAAKAALRSLGAIAEERAAHRDQIILFLTKCLADTRVYGTIGSWSRAQIAAELLGKLGPDARRATPYLERIAYIGDSRHRNSAQYALQQLAK